MNARKMRKFYKDYSWYDETRILMDIDISLLQLEGDIAFNNMSQRSIDLINTEIKSLNNIKSKILKDYPEYEI